MGERLNHGCSVLVSMEIDRRVTFRLQNPDAEGNGFASSVGEEMGAGLSAFLFVRACQ